MFVKQSSIRRMKMKTIAIVLATFWGGGAAIADDTVRFRQPPKTCTALL
jgi:hypothetical protein